MAHIPLNPKIAAGLVLELGTTHQRIEAAKFILDLTEYPKLLTTGKIHCYYQQFLKILFDHGITHLG